jgi:hypothetical protein
MGSSPAPEASRNPSAAADMGVLVALPAVLLISMTGARTAGAVSASARDGILAGIGFAVLFIAVSRSGDDAGMWPRAVRATTSFVLIDAVATPTLMRRRGRHWQRRDAITAGLADGLGERHYHVPHPAEQQLPADKLHPLLVCARAGSSSASPDRSAAACWPSSEPD